MQRRAAVLGSPIAHSRSPLLHRAAYQSLDLDWHYDAIEVREGELASFLRTCGPEWVGFSLTMPLKDEAWALADVRDDVADRTQCANTLLRDSAGWYGANTDVFGLVTAVREFIRDCPVPPITTAVIIGSGATARSAGAAAAELGAEQVIIRARNVEAARQVVDVVHAYGVPRVDVGPLADLSEALEVADLCVSTLPGSAATELVACFSDSSTARPRAGLLVDVAYDPWPSRLAQLWQPGLTISGLDMLLWQAVAQVELMTGQRPDVAGMRMAVH